MQFLGFFAIVAGVAVGVYAGLQQDSSTNERMAGIGVGVAILVVGFIIFRLSGGRFWKTVRYVVEEILLSGW